MSSFFRADKLEEQSTDFTFFILIFLILGLGLCSLFAASFESSSKLFNNDTTIISKQIIFSVVSMLVCFFISKVPFSWIDYIVLPFLGICLILSILVLIPGVGESVNGGQRWLQVPLTKYSFQPSEFVKLGIILYISKLVYKKGEKIRNFKNGFFPIAFVLTVFSLLVLLQNDLSSFILIFSIGMILLFAGGAKTTHMLGLLALFAITGLVVVFLIVPEKSYRIFAFLSPEKFEHTYGYQVTKSIEAISSGGLLGKGFGAGTLKYRVPELHSDYIFSSVAEDVGFIGVFFVIILFSLFLIKGFQSAYYVREDKFKYLLVVGIICLIGFQFFLNLAVVSGLAPTTGVPLPFFSAGGTSLLITFVMCGLLINVSKDAKSNKEA